MTDRIALVTGASRGLGFALAEELATRGWHVVAVARTVGGLEELDDRVKEKRQPGAGELTLAPMDITNDDAMRHLCRSIFDRWGGIDLWVHTAIHAAPMAPAGAAVAASAHMRGSWAVMLRYAAPVALPWDGAFINTGPLRWITRDSSKPGRTGPETWLLHASAEWSEAHIEDSAESVTAALIAAFEALGGPAPLAATAHRWRYADTEPALTLGNWWDASLRLGMCGDWLNGGKVEGAWLSGRALAAHMQPG